MAQTYIHETNLDDEDETQVTVEFKYTPGCSAHMGSMSYPGHPAEPAEVEIQKVVNSTTGETVTLTDAEGERICQWLIENHVETDDRDWEQEAKDARDEDRDQHRDLDDA